MNDHDSVGEDPVEHAASDRKAIRSARSAGRAATVALALLTVAWWTVGRPPFSASATAAVVAIGGAAALYGARMPPRQRPIVHHPPALTWAVLAVAAGLWELSAYAQHPRHDHPTLSSMANSLLDSHPARAAAFALWVVAAGTLARR